MKSDFYINNDNSTMNPEYKVILVIMILIIFASFSAWYAKRPGLSDFAAFYRAASIITDPNMSAVDIYNNDDLNLQRYNIPSKNISCVYRYSMFATYLISPLALLNYTNAEATMIFINLCCYAASIFFILKSLGAKNRWFLYPYAFSFLWMPFIQNIRFVQINSILLFLMTIAVFLTQKKQYVAAGIVLAVAALFKPFFLAITMVLCIKNWRIIPGFLGFMVLGLLLPGTEAWFKSFLWPPHPDFCYSAFYKVLGPMNNYHFIIYALGIGFITALITYCKRQSDFFKITAFAIPAAFLAMPVIEANHLTILIFSYAYCLFQKLNPPQILLIALSFLLIYFGSCINQGGILICSGLLILWLESAYMMINNNKTPEPNIF